MPLENEKKRRRTRRMALLIIAMVLSVLGTLGYLLLLFLRHAPQYMVVKVVDSQGRLTRLPRVLKVPAADHVEVAGLGQLHSYVTRLMASNARFTSLLTFTPDQLRGIGLHFTGGQTSISLNVEWRRYPEKEQAIRTLFSSIQIQPSMDYLARNGSVADATRILEYSLPGDANAITAICKRVLREIYGVTEEEALDYTYQEHG